MSYPAATNYFTNPRLVDANADGAADIVSIEPGGGGLTNVSGVQRFAHTAAGADSGPAMYTTGLASDFAVGDPITAQVVAKASATGCTARMVLFDQAWTVVGQQAFTLDGVERVYSFSGVVPAGMTALNLYWMLVEGVAAGDIYDVSVSKPCVT